MKRFSELRQPRVAAIGLVITAAVLLAAVGAGAIKTALVGTHYSAVFATAGGLRGGEDVRVRGHTVGEVGDLSLRGNTVRIDLTLTEHPRLGDRTRAAIKIKNPLGAKFLELTPAGPGRLEPGSTIPLSRTRVPFTIIDALSGLTRTTARIDTGRLSTSLDVLSRTFSDTPPRLRAALSGVRRLSETISSRDQQLGTLLDHTADVSGVLAQRRGQIITLLSDGNALFAELQRRRLTIHELLVNTTRVTRQLSGFVADNRATLKPALDQLRRAVGALNRNEDDLRRSLRMLGGYARALNESLGGGPWFYVYLQNLVPTNLVPGPGLGGGPRR